MSWLWGADGMGPRSKRKAVAADEAVHLNAHKNRNCDLVRVEKRVDLRSQTYVGQKELNKSIQASYWDPTESHINPCKQA